jgi:hypothetical protein
MNFKYSIGQIVYLKTDERQLERMVIKIIINCNGHLYELAESVNESTHYEIEISEEKNVLITL